MNNNNRIMILDDDIFFGNLVKNFLKNHFEEKIDHFTIEDVFLRQLTSEPSIIILDHHLNGCSGLDIIPQILSISPSSTIIYLSGQEFMHVAIKAMRMGVVDYIEKDRNSFYQLKHIIDKVLFKPHSDGESQQFLAS
ncbi:MAG: response regulator [Flavobacteriia bacterium]